MARTVLMNGVQAALRHRTTKNWGVCPHLKPDRSFRFALYLRSYPDMRIKVCESE
jgi:hypothetical protein